MAVAHSVELPKINMVQVQRYAQQVEARCGRPSTLMQAALAPELKAASVERSSRRAELDRRIDVAADAADEIENNARACLGIELQSVAANHRHVEAAARQLKSQVRELARNFRVHVDRYEALTDAAANAGISSLPTWLAQSEAILDSIRSAFTTIENSLAGEEIVAN